MQDDQLFSAILACGLAVVLPVEIYYRVRSQASGEKLDRRREGLFILLTLRPLALVGMIGLLTFVASPSRMAWSALPLPPVAPVDGCGSWSGGRLSVDLDVPEPGN